MALDSLDLRNWDLTHNLLVLSRWLLVYIQQPSPLLKRSDYYNTILQYLQGGTADGEPSSNDYWVTLKMY